MKGSQQTVAGAIAVSEEDIVGQVKKKTQTNKQTFLVWICVKRTIVN